MTDSGKLQNLRDFTVQIRTADQKIVIGTGVLVSPAGLVATCSHVVRDALAPGPVALGATVGVYLRTREGRPNAWPAKVWRRIEDADDDVVLLQVENLSPGEEEVAVLGEADSSEGNAFRSYGFQQLAPHPASLAEGRIRGAVDPPDGVRLKADLVQISSSEIDRGMSGAAVLDVERNLVVGLISETWIPGESGKNRDTAWAVDARVLAFPPFALPLRDLPLPRRPAREPQSPPLTGLDGGARLELDLHGALPLPAEWVDRDDLFAALTADHAGGELRIVGLVGFGGEGKSSLARKWMDVLIQGDQPPAGVFWWSFNTQPNVEAFLEAALRFLSAGRIDPALLPGASARVQVIAAMLGARPVLFVLDGLESVQRAEGDEQGELLSPDLRELLELFAESRHGSFCLLTSRLPAVDLVAQPTYRQYDVSALTAAQGRNLLRKLGVRGPDEALDRLVEAWGGHALTLSLLGSYLSERAGGDAARAAGLSLPALGESRWEKLRRILDSYDRHLRPDERAFLGVASLFRQPVTPAAFEGVFRAPSLRLAGRSGRRKLVQVPFTFPLAALGDEDFQTLVDDLVAQHLLRHDTAANAYSLHPLVRVHYAAAAPEKDLRALHAVIADHYAGAAQPPSDPPLLRDYLPWIEAVHHLALAGEHEPAMKILWGRLLEQKRYVLTRVLGAYESILALLTDFFPDGDFTRECLVRKPLNRRRVLRETAFTLMTLGRTREALPLYDLLLAGELQAHSWAEASLACQDLCRLNAALGRLAQAEDAVSEALQLARDARLRASVRNALLIRGWVRQLRGDLEGAGTDFEAGVALASDRGHSLEGLRGALLAGHLRQSGETDRARELATTGLAAAEHNHQLYNQSRFHRLLGELDAGAGELASAGEHFDAAVRQARGTSDRLTLIEALVSRGSFLVGTAGSREAARIDLQDALARARESGFRLLEIDGRIALARLLQAEGNQDAARTEAEAARQAALEIGYPGAVARVSALGVVPANSPQPGGAS